VPATALSALCGWLLARGAGSGYDTKLLDWHMWAGFSVAAACVLALVMHWLNWRAAYGVALLLLFSGLLVTSHWGGSLTHGQGYLTHYLPAFERQWSATQPATAPAAESVAKLVPPAAQPRSRSAFSSLVQPIMVAKCVACHGPNKAKAGLRLDTLEAMLKGRRSGLVIVPGQAAASELIECLIAPPQQDDHMPPASKPQLTPDEIALLRWWIEAGAAGDKTPAELKLPPTLQHLIPAVGLLDPAR